MRTPFLVFLLAVLAAAPAEADQQPASAKAAAPHYTAFVDMKTFMDHVLTPAATIIWRANGTLIDAGGSHDLAPHTDADWEQLVSGSATLAEATNALMIPERARDAQWNFYVGPLAKAAARAYRAAEDHDLAAIGAVSDQLDGICAACHKHYGLE